MEKQVFGKQVKFGKNAVVTGNVEIGEQTSIWHNVVLRGDVEPIIIGKKCNIQDNTVMHGQLGECKTIIGDEVSVGHSCLLHGCILKDFSFVGMGSMVMNGALIGSHVLIAAGSLIPENKEFTEPYTLVMGRPGKVIRQLNEHEKQMMKNTIQRYIQYAKQWL